jgi:hypothetical protein
MCQCGERLQVVNGAATCAACGTKYREEDGRLRLIEHPTTA